MWASGDSVALRDIWFGEVWRAVPAHVVDDQADATALFIPVGCESIYPAGADGRELRLAVPAANRARRRTTRPVLALFKPDGRWSIWHFYDESGAFDHWYVNFERTLGRGPSALDYVDHKLDLIARPDGSLVWKDEHELDEAMRRGLLDGDAVRRDADRVLCDPPWPTGWETFSPDASWPIPELPPGWDIVS
jgi:hypothetical protein